MKIIDLSQAHEVDMTQFQELLPLTLNKSATIILMGLG